MSNEQLKRGYMSPELILKLLIDPKNSDEILEMILNPEYEIITSLYAVYEAVSSVNEGDPFSIDNLNMLLKHVKISVDFEKGAIEQPYPSIPEGRQETLRQRAFRK